MTTANPTPGVYRARIEQELSQRLATAKAAEEAPAAAGGPLALRCVSCGQLNGYHARACQRCATAFNAEIVWVPALTGEGSGGVR